MTTPSSFIALALPSAVLLLSNVFGNTLVCLAILLNGHMKTPLNYLIFNLAVADTLLGVFAIPVNLLSDFLIQETDSTAAEVMCRFFVYGTMCIPPSAVSSFSLAAIAYERYQAIVYPLTARVKITKKKTFIFIAINWVFAVCLSTPWFFWFDLNEGVQRECKIKPEYEETLTVNSYAVGSMCLGVPVIAMVGFYGRIIWELIKENDRILEQQQLAASRTKKKITAMLITITVLYATLWGICFYFIRKFHDGRRDPRSSSVVVHLILVNSSINWILYALFSEQFRKCFMRIMCCCFKLEGGVGQRIRVAAVNPQTEKSGNNALRESDMMDTKL